MEAVVAVKVYFVNVVLSAVVPVITQREVPAAELRLSLTRGNIVPWLAVFFIHTLKVMVEPAGINPDALGTPLCVSKALIRYSPVATFFKFAVCSARLVPSGPAVFS